MQLSDYFDNTPTAAQGQAWQSLWQPYAKQIPIDIALITIEEKGANRKKNISDTLLKTFAGLESGRAKQYALCYLGSFKTTENSDEDMQNLADICAYLIKKNIIPLIVAANKDWEQAQIRAIASLKKTFHSTFINAYFDIKTESNHKNGAMFEDLLYAPEVEIVHIGSQEFLNTRRAERLMRKKEAEILSIGKMRTDLKQVEILTRHTHTAVWDMNALKMQDAPAQKKAQVFGMNADEAARVAWYLGIATDLKSSGIYGFIPDLDHRGQTAKLIATLIWYFVEGVYHRSYELPVSFIKYIVPLPSQKIELIFYKGKNTDKWWVAADKKPEAVLIPCSINDFEAAKQHGILPECWLKAQKI
ncbi:MAG: arginase family protein [Bernardetiaceae bacterium]|nr:arginase family protein [Bernardetiaceae bacterium]